MIKKRVAIIGSGNIGTDLLIKIQRSSYLECVLFIGRNLSSPGMAKAISLGVKVSDESIQAIILCDPICILGDFGNVWMHRPEGLYSNGQALFIELKCFSVFTLTFPSVAHAVIRIANAWVLRS